MKGLQNWPLLLAVLVASIALMAVGSTGSLRTLENGAAVVLVPVQYTIRLLGRGVTDVLRLPHDLRHLRSENERLRSQLDKLGYQLVLKHEVEIENAHLRALLHLKDQSPEIFGPDADLLAAEVIGRDPGNLLHQLTIDRGGQDRVKPGMPVITAGGLVGQIDEVRPNSATVRLLTDPSSHVGALLQRSRATGIVQGVRDLSGPGLIIDLLPQTDGIVERGDLVLTSGLGGRFPRRLLIGEVSEVQRRDVALFQQARLRPAVDLGGLERVIVVRYFTPIGVGAPPGDSVGPTDGSR